MSLMNLIPRYLLPQRGLIWRNRSSSSSTTSLTVRHASKVTQPSPKTSKPLVLEKPAKFNPPSHPARLRKNPPRYSGPRLSNEDIARQKTKNYPNLMPSPGTFMHWFLHSTGIHLFITLGTLLTLAATVFITDFKNSSPFAHMLPHWSKLFTNPISYFRTWAEVIKLNTALTTAESRAKRTMKTADVAKRAAYRKAHGLDQDEGFGGWTLKTDEETLGPGIPIGDAAMLKDGDSTLEPVGEQEVRQRRPIKKWLGIW